MFCSLVCSVDLWEKEYLALGPALAGWSHESVASWKGGEKSGHESYATKVCPWFMECGGTDDFCIGGYCPGMRS